MFWSHDKLVWRRGEGGGEKQWTAKEFWDIQNGGSLLRFPFEDLLYLKISDIIMETFTLGTAIGLNMNASFYADSVNASAWNKERVFFLVGCGFESCNFMKSSRLESFQRDRGIYGKRVRFTRKEVLAILECLL